MSVSAAAIVAESAPCKQSDADLARVPSWVGNAGIGNQLLHQLRQFFGGMHAALSLGGEQRNEYLLEIVGMRAGHDGGSEPGRFQRILSAMRHEASTEEGERRGTIEQAQFPHRVGDIKLGVRRGQRVPVCTT